MKEISMERSQVYAVPAMQPVIFLGGVLILQKDGHSEHEGGILAIDHEITKDSSAGDWLPNLQC